MKIIQKGFFFFILISLTLPVLTFAHTVVGIYAGTHVVDLEAVPHSPLVGEEISMTFRLRDLSLQIPKEEFIIVADIIENADSPERRPLARLDLKQESPGVYKTIYAFQKPGVYEIEFTFHKPHEPDIAREAIFVLEVRDLARATKKNGVLFFIFGLVAGVLCMKLLRALVGAPKSK